MSKFKVGDEVTLKEDISSVYLKHNKEYIVDKVFDDKLFVQGVDFKYDSNIFELVKESNMNKFKVGDKVVRTGLSVGKALQGGVYEISEVFPLISNRLGINLEGYETDGIVSFQYYSSGFELFDDDILTPLEATDAILHKEPLQEFYEHTGEWCDFACSLKGITLDMLQNTKFRRKPKTVVINGVEVVAPIDTKSLGYPDKVYGVNLSRKSVYDTTGHTDRGLFWATEEDAQEALDAMLIPFNQ